MRHLRTIAYGTFRSFSPLSHATKRLMQSNVVVTGVPTKNYRLPSEWIRPHTTVVNVASFKNVNEDEILQIEGVQYVPMVGKVTGEFP
jgi:hypothetical protein